MPLGYVTMLSRVLRVSKFRNPIKQISSLDLNPRSTPCTQCNPSGWKGPSPGKAQSLRLAHSDLAPLLQFQSIGHQPQKPQSLFGVGIGRRSWSKSIMTWEFKLDGLGNWAAVVVFSGRLSVLRFRNKEWQRGQESVEPWRHHHHIQDHVWPFDGLTRRIQSLFLYHNLPGWLGKHFLQANWCQYSVSRKK